MPAETPLPCPYVVGAKFCLQVTPPTGTPYKAWVTVVETFGPFTISPVMKVVVNSTSDNYCPATRLPAELVFKVFDRRFALSLRDHYKGKPATHESEARYQQHAKSRPTPEGIVEALQEIDDVCPGGLRACPPELFEQLIVAHIGGYFDSECAAYERLASLQGRDIPTFFGHTIFIDGLSIPDLDPPTPGVLLEFIPGVSLDKIDPASPDLDTIIREAIRITNSYGDLGVLNLDVRLGNFIVKPNRSVVMIDFAQSRLRREDEDDLGWIREKWAEDEEGTIGYEARSDFKWTYVRSNKYRPPPRGN